MDHLLARRLALMKVGRLACWWGTLLVPQTGYSLETQSDLPMVPQWAGQLGPLSATLTAKQLATQTAHRSGMPWAMLSVWQLVVPLAQLLGVMLEMTSV